jgi:hypothetical protein
MWQKWFPLFQPATRPRLVRRLDPRVLAVGAERDRGHAAVPGGPGLAELHSAQPAQGAAGFR